MPVEQSVIEDWLAGRAIPGVAFRLNELVRILAGQAAEQSAWVVCLVELEPLRVRQTARAGWPICT